MGAFETSFTIGLDVYCSIKNGFFDLESYLQHVISMRNPTIAKTYVLRTRIQNFKLHLFMSIEYLEVTTLSYKAHSMVAMEEMGSSSSSPLSNHKKNSLASRLRKSCLSFAASIQETFRYVKAFFVGQAKIITARNEKEASAAELEATKMQVEAADAAEDIKNGLNKSA
ncbi:hypothetical protein VNO77_31769 [Canavalia gladiata]|uniref:Uncharacterized protein n=1 Tax=Canavalia gladiata TaxID=3824 RepID=A0AAN9KPF5_CANGL